MNTWEGRSVTEDEPQQTTQKNSVLPEQSSPPKKKMDYEILEDYETQLFGFTPESFVSGIYNAVSEYFMEALQVLEDYLQERYKGLMTVSNIRDGMTVIRNRLVTQIDTAFDRLEVYLAANIFCVPVGVVLPEDQVQIDTPITSEQFEQVQRNIQTLKNKILAVKLANAILKQRLQYTMELQEIFDDILQRLNTAQATTRQEGVADLHDSLSHYAKSVLSTLRTLSSIKPLDLGLGTQDGPSQSKKKKSSES